MIAHISIGVSDIGKSKRFYDASLEPLGYRCIRAARAATGYGYGFPRFSNTELRPNPAFQQTAHLPGSHRTRRVCASNALWTRSSCGPRALGLSKPPQ